MQSFNGLTSNNKMFLKANVFFVLVAVAIAVRLQVDLRMPSILQSILTPFTPRIVGGEEAPVGRYPFIVSLQYLAKHKCAGSILNEHWIVTAAHCFPRSYSINLFVVRAGKHNLRNPESSEQTVGIVKIYVHEEYVVPPEKGGVGPYDIALLKLKSPLELNERVQSIELAPSGSEPTGEAWLSGWGSISNNRTPIMPDNLQHVKMEYINRATCYAAILHLMGSSSVHETNICTGPLYDQISSCINDSGGPLISYNGQKPILTGIVSWGICPCGTAGAPSIYTKVSKFNEWIAQKIFNDGNIDDVLMHADDELL